MMIQGMWFNLHVANLDKSEAFYRALGFEIKKNPDMFDKMLGIAIGDTTVILIENNHFENVSQQNVVTMPNEVMISLGVKTNEEVDQLVAKVKQAGGIVIQEPTVSQGYYGAMFKDLDGHHFNFLVC